MDYTTYSNKVFLGIPVPLLRVGDLLGDLKDSQEPDTAENRDPEWWHDLRGGENNLSDAADHHKTVKTVEQRYKVALDKEEGEK